MLDLICKLSGLSRQFVLFLIMGGLNTVFYYGLYAALIWFGVAYPAAVAAATAAGVVFNFNTFGRVVFRQFRAALIFRFVAVYIVLGLANIVGIRGFELIGVTNKYSAGAILTLPVALLGYFLNKTFVFKKGEKP